MPTPVHDVPAMFDAILRAWAHARARADVVPDEVLRAWGAPLP
jgi:hypothetical protein